MVDGKYATIVTMETEDALALGAIVLLILILTLLKQTLTFGWWLGSLDHTSKAHAKQKKPRHCFCESSTKECNFHCAFELALMLWYYTLYKHGSVVFIRPGISISWGGRVFGGV